MADSRAGVSVLLGAYWPVCVSGSEEGEAVVTETSRGILGSVRYWRSRHPSCSYPRTRLEAGRMDGIFDTTLRGMGHRNLRPLGTKWWFPSLGRTVRWTLRPVLAIQPRTRREKVR